MRLLIDSYKQFIEAHRIVEAYEQKIPEIVPGADVILHADPEDRGRTRSNADAIVSDLLDNHRSIFVGYYDLSIIRHDNSYLMSIHLEMGRDDPLDEVQRGCDHLERENQTAGFLQQVDYPCGAMSAGNKLRDERGRCRGYFSN